MKTGAHHCSRCGAPIGRCVCGKTFSATTPLNWRKNTETPEHLQQMLIIENGQIDFAVHFWDANIGKFVHPSFYQKEPMEIRTPPGEIEAWLGICDIPLATWASKRRENVPQKPSLHRADDKKRK